MVSNIVGSPHGIGCGETRGETRGLAQWNNCADTEYGRVLEYIVPGGRYTS